VNRRGEIGGFFNGKSFVAARLRLTLFAKAAFVANQNLIDQIKRLETVIAASSEWSRCENAEYDAILLSFTDGRLHYVLQMLPTLGTAQLSADPNRELPSCPLLEYSFRFTHFEIGDSAYGPGLAVRFYDGATLINNLRLTLTRLPNGLWYTWANSNPSPYPDQGK